MSTANGFVQGYNAQAVANEEQVIVAAEVTDEHNDLRQLHPMIDATNASLAAAGIDQRPDILLADAGYASEENFAALDDGDPDCYVATRNMRNNPTPRNGRRGPLPTRRSSTRWTARCHARPGARSTGAAKHHRTGLRSDQRRRGIRRFMRRGKAAADSEWKLIAGTHNLLKLYRRALTDPAIAPYSRIAAAITG